jgi:hypothetical protein
MDQQKQDLLEANTDQELISSLLREVAKAKHEINTAEADCAKAKRRLSFAILLANRLLERETDGFKSSSKKTQTRKDHAGQ